MILRSFHDPTKVSSWSNNVDGLAKVAISSQVIDEPHQILMINHTIGKTWVDNKELLHAVE